MAREHVILPLSVDGETLTCAAADPNDLLLADKLSFIVNRKVRFVRFPREAIRAAINYHYGRTETESVDSMLCEFTDTAVTFGESDSGSEVLPRGMARRLRHGGAKSAAPAAPARSPLALGMAAGKKKLRRAADDEDFELDLSETGDGEDTTPDYGTETMWYYTVEEGQRALMVRRDGRMEVIVGPRRVWKGYSRFEKMRHFVAHPGEFLIVRFRDGRQEHLPGPAGVWFDRKVRRSALRPRSPPGPTPTGRGGITLSTVCSVETLASGDREVAGSSAEPPATVRSPPATTEHFNRASTVLNCGRIEVRSSG